MVLGSDQKKQAVKDRQAGRQAGRQVGRHATKGAQTEQVG
jgi:hypothetical protein